MLTCHERVCHVQCHVSGYCSQLTAVLQYQRLQKTSKRRLGLLPRHGGMIMPAMGVVRCVLFVVGCGLGVSGAESVGGKPKRAMTSSELCVLKSMPNVYDPMRNERCARLASFDDYVTSGAGAPVTRVGPAYAKKDGVELDLAAGTQWGRCAVVSDSPRLLNHAHGINIDTMDAVMRFNAAPTKGFERYVGSKTSIRMTNHADGVKSAAFMDSASTFVAQGPRSGATGVARARRIMAKRKSYGYYVPVSNGSVPPPPPLPPRLSRAPRLERSPPQTIE